MNILVLGATGTIGKAVADALAPRHTVIRASRASAVSVDVRDPDSLAAVFDKVGELDAVVACAGDVVALREKVMGPLLTLGRQQIDYGAQRLVAELRLVQLCAQHLNSGGSLTLTTGLLSTHPQPGSTVGSMMGAAAESLVRSAALEMPRGIRVNAVSPGWIKETMERFGMDSQAGMPAATLASFYVKAVEGTLNGVVINPLEASPTKQGDTL